jgi:predicted dehydrogenase
MSQNKLPAISRRSFFAATALGLATTASSAPPSVRAGLIGHGELGMGLYQDTKGLPMGVVSVADTNPARLTALPQSAQKTSVWQALSDDPELDAILIAAPDYLHARMGIAALEAGKNVYLAPPFSHTGEEATRLLRTASASSGQLHVAMDTSVDAHWIECVAATSETGTLRWIQADVPIVQDRPHGHWSRQRSKGHGDAASALFSSLYPLMHRFSLGAPQRATLLGGIFDAIPRETPDALSLSADFDGGLCVTLTTRRPGEELRPTTLRGQQGSIEIPAPTSTSRYDLAAWTQSLHLGTAPSEHLVDVAYRAQSTLCQALSGLS